MIDPLGLETGRLKIVRDVLFKNPVRDLKISRAFLIMFGLSGACQIFLVVVWFDSMDLCLQCMFH